MVDGGGCKNPYITGRPPLDHCKYNNLNLNYKICGG